MYEKIQSMYCKHSGGFLQALCQKMAFGIPKHMRMTVRINPEEEHKKRAPTGENNGDPNVFLTSNSHDYYKDMNY